jgi:hypothetical protein
MIYIGLEVRGGTLPVEVGHGIATEALANGGT